MSVFATRAFVENGWAKDVRLEMARGRITRVLIQSRPEPGDTRVDTLLPALSNVHSHSFQRAMAGMTEFRARDRESFWTWRTLMYRFLDRLSPEQFTAIAQLAFMEMQQAGYAAVGEFHYVHHAPGGAPYDDRAEMSGRIMQAAQLTGIGLTHLPVLYTYGDVGQKPLAGGQLRFHHTLDGFVDLVELCRQKSRSMPFDTRIGFAVHSLRATSPADLAAALAQGAQGPIHMHIAEQIGEVDRVKAQLGARPVEWLLQNADVNPRWCLIHATHMNGEETRALARSGAVAGLCPVTEANLGDGIFNGADFLRHNGAIAIGTDSNVNIALTQELRLLEYSQRLKHRERNVLVTRAGSTGKALYVNAARGGAQALGRDAGVLAPGRLADMLAIDSTIPSLCCLRDDQLLDGLIFAADDTAVTDLWSAGRHRVRGGKHVARNRIIAQYRKAMAELTAVSG